METCDDGGCVTRVFYIHARNSAAPPRFYLRPRLLRRGASSTSKHPHRPCQKVFFGGGNFTRSALLMMSRTIFLAMTFGRSSQGVANPRGLEVAQDLADSIAAVPGQ